MYKPHNIDNVSVEGHDDQNVSLHICVAFFQLVKVEQKSDKMVQQLAKRRLDSLLPLGGTIWTDYCVISDSMIWRQYMHYQEHIKQMEE